MSNAGVSEAAGKQQHVGVMSKLIAFLTSLPVFGALFQKLACAFGSSDDQNLSSLFAVLSRYRSVDFVSFLKSHREALKKGHETGDYVAGVCNYYTLMSDLITLTSGPFWHFVPMTKGLSRKQCHDQFHHTMVKFLQAKKGENILEFGCGYGEIGRQVAKISGANVTGLTMSDAEIVGGNQRIAQAGLQEQCVIKQGNYHSMPFESESFDKVFGVYCLKYSADLETAISEAARVLKKGGRLVSYEILVTDKYNPDDKQHRYYVDNISHSTCMPPLWPAQAFRDAAKKAGFELKEETDLCSPPEGSWYSCFERTGIFSLLMNPLVKKLVGLSEGLGLVQKGFTEFFDECLVHPTTDFVLSGRLGIVTGSIMMVWEKK